MLHNEFMDFDKAKVGDLVRGDFIEEMMCCLPPATMWDSCSQVGEPYSHRKDERTGKWRATYSTWHLVERHGNTWSRDSLWVFDGACFRGENENREPKYA